MTATVVRPGQPPEPQSLESAALDRGVVLEAVTTSGRAACAYAIAAGRPDPGGVVLTRRGRGALRFEVRGGATTPVDVPVGPRFEAFLALPNESPTNTTVGATGTLTLHAFAPARGAELRATFTLDMPLTPGRVLLEGELRTFVRDIDPLPDRCTAQQ